MKGVLERIYDDFKEKVRLSRGVVKLDYIRDFVRDLQNHEYDAHIVIMGQNGNGKSMLMLELMKRIDPNSIMNGNLLFASNTTRDLISLIKKSKKTIIGIDEAKRFFHYKFHMYTEQIVLTNMIEYARSNNIAFISCANDIRRLTSNYRNAKVQMVIWLLDKYDDNEIGKSYGLVFLGNPALEEEDKFQMNAFTNLYTFEQIRYVAERLHTFVGYIFVEDIHHIVTEEELRYYIQKKQESIIAEAERYAEKLENKEKTKENSLAKIKEWYEKICDMYKEKPLMIKSFIKEKLQSPNLTEEEYLYLEKKYKLINNKIKLAFKT